MQVSMIKIGNSRGVRLPKHVIDAAGLKDDLALEVRDGAVIVRNARTPRSGWAAAAADCHASAEDDLGDWDGAAGGCERTRQAHLVLDPRESPASLR